MFWAPLFDYPYFFRVAQFLIIYDERLQKHAAAVVYSNKIRKKNQKI